MNFRIVLFSAVLLTACNRPAEKPAPVRVGQPVPTVRTVKPPQPAIALSGTFSDGTPLELEALRGRPWVINLWLPG